MNLLGYFSPLTDDCELYDLLHGAGVKTIHEISRCKDYAQYQTMSEANFNLVLHPEARFAAEDFHDRLKFHISSCADYIRSIKLPVSIVLLPLHWVWNLRMKYRVRQQRRR